MSAPVQSATALYLHVPFCASSCDFCSFYQEQPKRSEIDRYLSAIEREMELHPPGRVETAFWGGGTPGLLPAEDLLRLGKAMTKAAGQPGEWSVELAPSSVRADKLAALKEIGVTRVSMAYRVSMTPRSMRSAAVIRPNRSWRPGSSSRPPASLRATWT